PPGHRKGGREANALTSLSRGLAKTAGAGFTGLIDRLHRRVRPIAKVRATGPDVGSNRWTLRGASQARGRARKRRPCARVATAGTAHRNRRFFVRSDGRPPTGERLWNERLKSSRLRSGKRASRPPTPVSVLTMPAS